MLATTLDSLTHRHLGYIKIDQFTTQTYDEFIDNYYDLIKYSGKLDGLVIDLRGNGGGIMQQALNIINLFVPKGTLLLKTKGRRIDNEYYAMRQPLDTVLPLLVLIDSASASASEIVAGVFQDLDRATIAGQNSYGKGLVQEIFSIGDERRLKLTTAKYYIPSGRCIQKEHRRNYDDDVVVDAHSNITDTHKLFYTKSGRPVTEQNGIVPDYIIKPDTLKTPLAKELMREFVPFSFANYYANECMDLNDAQLLEVFVKYCRDSCRSRFRDVRALDSLSKINQFDIAKKELSEAADALLQSYEDKVRTTKIFQEKLINTIRYLIAEHQMHNAEFMKWQLQNDEVLVKAVEKFKFN
jgi:carboxyl-terminal processing protease